MMNIFDLQAFIVHYSFMNFFNIFLRKVIDIPLLLNSYIIQLSTTVHIRTIIEIIFGNCQSIKCIAVLQYFDTFDSKILKSHIMN